MELKILTSDHPKRSPNLYIRFLGYLLCGTSLWLLYGVFTTQSENIQHVRLDATSLGVFVFALLVIVLGHMNLVMCWVLQLRKKHANISFQESFISIGLSQIAKYIPGNFAHFIGRAILVKDVNSKSDVALAMLIETLMMVVTALLGACIWSVLFYLPSDISIWAIVGVTVAFFSGTYLTIEIIKRRFQAFWLQYRTLSLIILLNAFIFILHGIVLFLIAEIVLDVSGIFFLTYGLGFSAAFLVGYLLPGAPGGIGVREYTFVLLFSSQLGEAIALEVIVLHRILAILGDLVFFLMAYAWKLKRA